MTGFYTFRWDQPATEVYVTGTFDNWSQSQKLERIGNSFVKKIPLPKERILYKFVVDHNWRTDPNAPVETEHYSGIQNNVLLPSQIQEDKEPQKNMSQANINSAAPNSTTAQLVAQVPLEETATSNGTNGIKNANISSVAPESTTAALAGNVPKETTHTNNISSAAPDSTTAALAGGVPVETPGANAVPGGFPETPANEIHDPTPITPPSAKEEPQQFSVNPLPASDTAENPITLQPGEPVPRDVGTQSLTSNVKLDKESYEAGATNFPVGNLVLPNVVTPAEQREREGRGVLDLPAITGAMIPESSLPIVGASEKSKTAEVPEIVKESQEKADVPAEASGVPDSLEKKADVEQELKSKVTTVPAAAEGNTITDQASSAVNNVTSTLSNAASSAAAGVTGAAAGIGAATGLTAATTKEEPAPQVPELVKESIAKAGAPAEASAFSDSVEAKKEFESELKREVPEAAATTSTDGEAVAPTAQDAPVVTDGITSSTIKEVDEAPVVDLAQSKTADFVPEPVKDSFLAAHAPAEAASVAAAVQKKEVYEQELKKQVHPIAPVAASATPGNVTPGAPSSPIAESAPGTPGTLTPAAVTPAVVTPAIAIPSSPSRSNREAAPIVPIKSNGSHSNGHSNGNGAARKESTSEPSINGTTSSKKAKRRSFFGRLQEKFHLKK